MKVITSDEGEVLGFSVSQAAERIEDRLLKINFLTSPDNNGTLVVCTGGILHFSLPEFMNFKLFGKTILVVNIKFELFLGHPLSK